MHTKFTLISDCIINPWRQDLSSLWFSGNQGPGGHQWEGAAFLPWGGERHPPSRLQDHRYHQIKKKKHHGCQRRKRPCGESREKPLVLLILDPLTSRISFNAVAHTITSPTLKCICTPSSKEIPASEWTCLWHFMGCVWEFWTVTSVHSSAFSMQFSCAGSSQREARICQLLYRLSPTSPLT